MTQEEMNASSDEEDAQKSEQEEGGLLLSLTQEVQNVDEETQIDCDRKLDGLEEVVEVEVAARV